MRISEKLEKRASERESDPMERWNDGMLEYWILMNRLTIGRTGTIAIKRFFEFFPSFHCSIIPLFLLHLASLWNQLNAWPF